MDTATRDSGDTDTARPHARLWRQLWRIDVGLASFALTGAGLVIGIFPNLPWLLKVGIAILVVSFWLWSVVGLARDKAQLERQIQLLESPLNTHEKRTAELRDQLSTRKSDLKAAEDALATAENALGRYHLWSDTDPEKMAVQAKIERAEDGFKNARDMRDRADLTLQEHIDKGPYGPDRKDVVESDRS